MFAADLGIDQQDTPFSIGHEQDLVLRDISRRHDMLDRVIRIFDILCLHNDPTDREASIYGCFHFLHPVLLAVPQKANEVDVVEAFDLRLKHLVSALQPQKFPHEARDAAFVPCERMTGHPLQQFLQWKFGAVAIDIGKTLGSEHCRLEELTVQVVHGWMDHAQVTIANTAEDVPGHGHGPAAASPLKAQPARERQNDAPAEDQAEQ
mmetsp:Transcript_42349/g.127994  ORF Transcript_42349/g.127994 Transcript_42349/m.127994 type:complete len:207 (+) Transcript_42349:1112-1732(+)